MAGIMSPFYTHRNTEVWIMKLPAQSRMRNLNAPQPVVFVGPNEAFYC